MKTLQEVHEIQEVDQDLDIGKPRTRRQAEDDAALQERGWKNKNKKKNRDKKKPKAKRKEEKTSFEKFLDNIEGPQLLGDDEPKEQLKEVPLVKDSPQEDEVEEAEKEEDEEQFTNGLQFSAYSPSRPVYRPKAVPEPSYVVEMEGMPSQGLLYGVDMEGEPQYMEQDALNILLANPHAKKVRHFY